MTPNRIQNPNPSADYQMYSELKEMLEAEIQKPYSERNYDLIDELTAAITSATVPESVYNESRQRGLQEQLQATAARSNSRKHAFLRPLYAACACLVILLISNAFAIHVTGSNLLKLTYSIFTDHFEFQYSSLDENSILQQINTSEDPYGIRAECEKYGFSPMVPHYLPDGFELTVSECNPAEKKVSANFTYKNANGIISFHCTHYNSPDLLDTWKTTIPSDQHNISELEINGILVVISKEDEQYTASFTVGQTLYTIFTEKISYDESDRILRSTIQ